MSGLIKEVGVWKSLSKVSISSKLKMHVVYSFDSFKLIQLCNHSLLFMLIHETRWVLDVGLKREMGFMFMYE